MDRRLDKLHSVRDAIKTGYGGKSAYMASDMKYSRDAWSTGWLMLDYALGIGGVAKNHQVEVYGVNDIGKTTAIGIPVLNSVQAGGGLVAIIALEPSFDPQYAEKRGLDLERTLILYPDNGVEAFEMTHDLLIGKDTGGEPIIDYVLFDSIGAVLREEEAIKGTPSAYGASQLITAATKANLMPCFKNNIGVMYLNQVRADNKSRIAGLFTSPGGEALKHNVMQRMQITPGGQVFREKVSGFDNVDIGRPLVAKIVRNKLAEGSNQRATCDYYHKEFPGKPFGIDVTKDIIDTALMTGVFSKSGSWYTHAAFPLDKKGERKLQGAPAISAHFEKHPEAISKIRNDVMRVMQEEQAKLRKTKREKSATT